MSVEHEPMTRRTWTWLLFVGGWLLAFGCRWLSDENGIGFGPFGNALFRSLVVVAILLSVPLVLHMCSRRRWAVGGLVVALVAVLGVAGGLLWSRENNIAAWYWLHRSDYLAVSQLAGSGTLDHVPASAASLSVTGQVVTLSTNNGKPIAYLPVFTGIPDCSSGYAWFSGPIEPRYTAPDAV